MEKYVYILIGVAVVAFFVYTYIQDRIKQNRFSEKKLREMYGKLPEREYSHEDYENISHYFIKNIGKHFYIDDITWNDLDMDRVFKRINNASSSAGEDYLYRMLREPELSGEKLEEFDSLSEFMDSHPEERLEFQKIFKNLGHSRRLSLSDYLENFADLQEKKTWMEWLNAVRVIIAIAVLLVNASIGILALIGVIIYNVLTYFKSKNDIGSFFVCTSYIARIIDAGNSFGGRADKELAAYETELKKLAEPLRVIVRKTNSIGNGSGVKDGILETFIEYRNMVLHTDIIQFYQVLGIVKSHIDDIWRILELLGRIEAAISVASFRNTITWCKPEFVDEGRTLECRKLYHILIDAPVSNDIKEQKSILLTGSNASGKSTFLKTVAINALLSQSIYTSPSEHCRTSFYRIYSSMSLRDDLEGGDSYYMVEIKALKRIMDAQNAEGVPVLCFVDEVLRGTNTVERIASSAKILEHMNADGAFVIAATHDIELTYMLENIYSNYHFQEEVLEGDIHFDYVLHEGRATTRNAIRLLGIMGYDKEVIDSADKCAAEFLETGEWKL